MKASEKLEAIFTDPEGNPVFRGSYGDHDTFIAALHEVKQLEAMAVAVRDAFSKLSAAMLLVREM
jgi:hypothetical protein